MLSAEVTSTEPLGELTVEEEEANLYGERNPFIFQTRSDHKGATLIPM